MLGLVAVRRVGDSSQFGLLAGAGAGVRVSRLQAILVGLLDAGNVKGNEKGLLGGLERV